MVFLVSVLEVCADLCFAVKCSAETLCPFIVFLAGAIRLIAFLRISSMLPRTLDKYVQTSLVVMFIVPVDPTVPISTILVITSRYSSQITNYEDSLCFLPRHAGFVGLVDLCC